MNFLDVLNTRAADVEKPEVLPEGTYVWKISKAHKESTASNGDYNVIEIPVVATEPYAEADDVDAEKLAAFGDLRASGNSIRFMFPTEADKENDRKRALFNLKRFLLDVVRVDADEDATIKELLGKMVGGDFIAQAQHRHDAARDATFVDVKNYMARD